MVLRCCLSILIPSWLMQFIVLRLWISVFPLNALPCQKFYIPCESNDEISSTNSPNERDLTLSDMIISATPLYLLTINSLHFCLAEKYHKNSMVVKHDSWTLWNMFEKKKEISYCSMHCEITISAAWCVSNNAICHIVILKQQCRENVRITTAQTPIIINNHRGRHINDYTYLNLTYETIWNTFWYFFNVIFIVFVFSK